MIRKKHFKTLLMLVALFLSIMKLHAQEPYAVLSDDNTTLTFYYDKNREIRHGMGVGPFDWQNDPDWYAQRESITYVVFDDSFASCTDIASTSHWFSGCTNLLSVTGIENLKTDNVTDMSDMFYNCHALTNLDISGFNTTNVNNMGGMFGFCSSLTSIDLRNFHTSNVTKMHYLFYQCHELAILDLSNFNTSKVTNMSDMFSGCDKLETIFVGAGWTTKSVANNSSMFNGCRELIGEKGTMYDGVNIDNTFAHVDGGKDNPGYLSTVESEQPARPYAVLSEDNTLLTFYYDNQKASRNGLSLYRGWSGPSIKRVDFDASFAKCSGIISTAYWFSGCSNLTSITGMGNLITDNVTDMTAMFSRCCSLTSLNLSSLNTLKVKNMYAMFDSCITLETIYVGSGWVTEAVTSSGYMFYDCRALVGEKGTMYNEAHTDISYAHIDGGSDNPGYFSTGESEPISAYAALSDDNATLTFYFDNNKKRHNGLSIDNGWNGYSSSIKSVVFDASFANCSDISSTMNWFNGCNNLTSITGIENLNTDNITNMGYMFYGCSSLTSLDISYFNTKNVTRMDYMFHGCSSLETIYVGEAWSTEKVTDGDNMFGGCTQLVGGEGTVYNAYYTDHTYAHVDGGTGNPGYLSLGATEPISAYFAFSNYDTTLTFYYDNRKKRRNGVSISDPSGWYSSKSSIKRVAFDASFADYKGITSTRAWFSGCYNLTSIAGIENLNTDNVTNMSSMFSSCSSLITLDISCFNTKNVTDMSYMFYGCSSLETIYVGETWSTEKVTYGEKMFDRCTNLIGREGTFYDDNHTDYAYARIDEGAENPGYLTTPGCEPIRAYAALSEDKTTLIFYYDRNKKSRNGMGIGPFSNFAGVNSGWYEYRKDITSVVFDASFANYSYVRSTEYWFYEFSKLTSITGLENLSTVNVMDMSSMFYRCSSLTSIDLSHFDTRNVTDMRSLFSGCSGLTSLNVNHLNTENVTDMFSMFCDCSSLTSIDLSHFDTRNVTDMRDMFSGCSGLTSLDVSSFNTTKVTNMCGVFGGCSGLTSLDLSNFNTENVVAMGYSNTNAGMFMGCSSLISLDLSHFDTKNVTDMGGMFSGCSSLTSLDLSNFNTENVTNMCVMFSGCSGLASLDLSNFDTEKVTDMSWMFAECENLIDLNVSSFDTSNVEDMSYMFWYCSHLKNLVSHFDTRKVTTMEWMFLHCKNLTSIDLSGFDTRNVTNMVAMFGDCGSLKSLDLSHFDTKNVTHMNAMFENCYSLTSLDVSSFDTRNVISMFKMFNGVSGLTSLDLSSFNTSKVTDMACMFGEECGHLHHPESKLESLNLSSFDTSNVTDMAYMFTELTNLKALDISNFDTSNVEYMIDMFSYCYSLETINVGEGWSTENIKRGDNMFSCCWNLVGGEGTTYDNEHTDHTYAHIDGGTDNPGYLTFKYSETVTVKGDLNGDNVVDVADIATVISVMADVGADPVSARKADVNGDGAIDVGDIATVISIMASK